MSEWQPVETAPKDAMIIGAFFGQRNDDQDYVTLCWWEKEFACFISGCRQMRLAAGYEFEGGVKTKLHSPDRKNITHWMPLPAAPE